MTEVNILPIDISERLFTQSCDCVKKLNFTQSLNDIQTAQSENNIDNYLKERSIYVYNYINCIFVHTISPLATLSPLTEQNECRKKDFISTNCLKSALFEHLQTITFMQNELEKEQTKKCYIILPNSVSNLLDIFGCPKLNRAIELQSYLELVNNFIKTSLLLHEKLLHRSSVAKPNSLLSYLKLEILTLRICTNYRRLKTIRNGIQQLPPNQIKHIQLGKPSITPVRIHSN